MSDFSELHDRLYRLERRERVWRRGAAIGALVLAAGLAAGMVPQRGETLRAEALVLTDAAGQTRGTFSAGADDPALVLTDSNGVKRLRLRIDEGGPSLSLFDERQTVRMHLSIRNEAPEVVLFSADRQPAVRLRGTHREPQVVVFDDAGRSRMKLFVLQEGESGLGSGMSLTNEEGRQQVLVTAFPDGTAAIRAGETNLSHSPKGDRKRR